MSILKTPNRAPGFNSLIANENEFNRQRDMLSAFSPAVHAVSANKPAFEKLAEFKRSGRLPGGFSMRNLSLEIAENLGGKIVSEHEGLIETLLVSVPRDSNPIDSRDGRHYLALFRGLGPWVKYIVVCDPKQKDAMMQIAEEAHLPPDHLRFAFSPRFNFSIWAQDAYVAINDPSGSMVLCEGVCFPRYDDMTIADDVAAQTDVSILQSYLYFQGGNILNTGATTLIGMDYILQNTGRHKLPDIPAVIDNFSRLFGTDVLALGGQRSGGDYDWYKREILSGKGSQPIFHIDMYVTPTGVAGVSGKEIVFLGRPETAKRAVGQFSDVPELDNAKYNSLFDETEEILSAKFEVRSLPLFITRGNLGSANYPSRYYNLTFNNCIVQNSGTIKRVLLPHYSQDAASFGVDVQVRKQLEQSAASEWQKIGFEVAWMDGIEDLAYGSGAVHCITKCLRRTMD